MTRAVRTVLAGIIALEQNIQLRAGDAVVVP